MNYWKESAYEIEGSHCVEHSVTGELAIFGNYGEIWKNSVVDYKALIRSHRVAKRYLHKSKWPIHSQDEILIKFPAQDLALWVKRLKVPAKASTQVELANRGQKNEAISSIINPSNGEICSSETQEQRSRPTSGDSSKTESAANQTCGTENLGGSDSQLNDCNHEEAGNSDAF